MRDIRRTPLAAAFARSLLATVLASASFAVLSPAAGALGPHVELVQVGGAPLDLAELHQGGVDVVGVAMTNPGVTPSLDFSLPSGTLVQSLSGYDATSGSALPGRWGCIDEVAKVHCNYHGGTATGPSSEIAYAVLKSADSATPSSGVAAIAVHASLAGGVVTSSVPVSFTSSNVPALNVSRSATPILANGATGAVAYVVHVLRASAQRVAGAPPVSIGHVIPSTVIASWSRLSPDWACVGASTQSPTCSYTGATLAAGTSTPPLIVRYVLRHDATTRTRTLAWNSEFVATGPFGMRVAGSLSSRVTLRARLAQTMKVAVQPLGGQTVVPGTTHRVAVLQAASDGVASGVSDTIVVPRGLRLLAERRDGWSCPSGTGTVTCRHSDPVLTSRPFPLVITLWATPRAPRGLAMIAVLSRALDGSVQNAGLTMLDVGAVTSSSIQPAVTAKSVTTPSVFTTHWPRRAAAREVGNPAGRSVVSAALARVGARMVHSSVPATTSPVIAMVPVGGAPRESLRESVAALMTLHGHAPRATPSPPWRQAHVESATKTPSALPSSALTAPPSTLTLGGVALTIVNGSVDANNLFSGTATGSIDGLSFNVQLSYLDASDWSFTVVSSPVTIFGQATAVTGSMSDGSLGSGALGGLLTLSFPSTTSVVYDGLTFSHGELSVAASSGSALAFTGSVTIGFNLVQLTANVTYSDASDWTMSLTGNNLLTFALTGSPGSLSVTGSIGDSGGTLSGTISGATSTPFTLTSGVSATGSLSFAFTNAAASNSALSFSGSLTLQIGSLSLPVSFTYSDPTAWSATLSVSSASGSFALTPTFSVPFASLTGSVAMVDGSVLFNVSATIASVALVPNAVTLSGVTLTLSSNCSPDFGPCPPGANDVYAMLGGQLQVSFPMGAASSVAFVAAYGMTTHGFDLTTQMASDASVDPNITLVTNVISLTAPTLEISYNDASYANLSGPLEVAGGAGTSSGLQVLVNGTMNLNIANNAVRVFVEAAYSNGELDIVGSTSAFNLGGTGAIIDGLGYFTQPTAIVINGATVNVAANSFVLAGTLTLPASLGSFLGEESAISVYAVYSNPTNFQISAVLKVSVPVPSSPDFTFQFNDVALSITMASGSLHFALTTSGTLAISGAASPLATQYDLVSASLTYDVTTSTLAIALSVDGTQNNPALVDAFGYSGLTLDTLSFSTGVTFGTGIPTPSFGVAASGTLPASVTADLGMGTGSNIPLGFALNVSAVNPCLQVSIGQPSGPTVINIGSGAITASYAMFSVAPNGCTIGTTTVQKGFAVAFSGTFLHTGVAFSATLTLNPTSFVGTGSLSGFQISGFVLHDSAVSVSITPTSFSLTFHGAIDVISPQNSVYLQGTIDSAGDMSLHGSATLHFAGFSFAARVDAQRVGTRAYVLATGTLHVAGQDIAISGLMKQSSSGVHAILSGSGHFHYGRYDLGVVSFDLQLSTGGFLFFGGAAQRQVLIVIASPNFGPLGSAQLYGTLSQSGLQVHGMLRARVSATLGSIASVTGALTVGDCTDGSCSNVGPVSASLAGSFTWQGRTYGFSGAAVAPSWGFGVSSSGAINAASGTIDIGLVQFRAWFAGSYTISLSSSSPFVSYSAQFHAQIQGVNGHLKTQCGGRPWRCHTGVVWGNWYYITSVGVSSDSQGNLSATYLGRTYRVRV